MELYHLDGSGPARACRLTAALLDLPLNLKVVNLLEKEQLQDWFIQINPQHTVPTLVDGDLKLGESRAIMRYLVNQHKPGSSLYPVCAKQRALVDRYLDFDLGTLYKALSDYYYPKLLFGAELDPEKEKKVSEVLGFLEAFLGGKEYLLGTEYSLADISIGTSLNLTEVFNYALPPKIDAYYKRLQKLPHWEEINGKGVLMLKAFLDKKKA